MLIMKVITHINCAVVWGGGVLIMRVITRTNCAVVWWWGVDNEGDNS